MSRFLVVVSITDREAGWAELRAVVLELSIVGPAHCYVRPKMGISEGTCLIVPEPAMISSMLQFITVLAIMKRVVCFISVPSEDFFPIINRALSLQF